MRTSKFWILILIIKKVIEIKAFSQKIIFLQYDDHKNTRFIHIKMCKPQIELCIKYLKDLIHHNFNFCTQVLKLLFLFLNMTDISYFCYKLYLKIWNKLFLPQLYQKRYCINFTIKLVIVSYVLIIIYKLLTNAPSCTGYGFLIIHRGSIWHVITCLYFLFIFYYCLVLFVYELCLEQCYILHIL